ncbi:aldo/keto reductase [Cohnella herbarum]|nr:aldo/keto reductase [Cohnella herbarum]
MIRPMDNRPSLNRIIGGFRCGGGNGLAYGFGAAWLGRNGLAPESVAEDVAVLERAYELGFRYYDTSIKYGNSEYVVGEFLAGKRAVRDSLFVATKSDIPEALSPEDASAYVLSNLEASLSRLRSDYVDLFQIHDVYTLHQVTADNGVLATLRKARDEGKVRYIGMATRPLDLLERSVSELGVDSVLTYSDYTPIDQSAGPLIRLGAERGVAVINGSPLSAGMLAGSDPRTLEVPEWHEESVKRRLLATEVYDLCAEFGVPMLAVTLQYPLRRPDIRMNLTGPKNAEELESTMAALRQPISAAFWEQLDSRNAGLFEPPI